MATGFEIRGDKMTKSGSAVLQNGMIQRKYTVVVQMLAPTGADTVEVGNNCGHAVGESYPLDQYAILREMTPRQTGPTAWEVTLQYETGSQAVTPNPLFRPVVKSWSAYETSMVMWCDLDGVPVLNSAGARFNPPIEQEVCIMVLTCKRNESYFNYALAYQYANSVNSSTFYGAPAGFVRCRAPQGVEKWENSYHYWEVTYEFHFSPYNWNLPVLDQGGWYWDKTATPWKKTLPSFNGTETTSVLLLNGSGGQLSDEDIQAGNVSYLNFRRYNSANFANLGL